MLPEQERNSFLKSLTEEELEALEYDWGFWARRNQIEPAGNWSVWLIMAGRGFGKTRSGAEWVRGIMCGASPLAPGLCQHLALVGETAADVREVMVGDGKDSLDGSGILQIHPKDFRPRYEPSKRRLTWPNGATATTYNATEPDQLRGPEHGAAWCDELAKWQYAQDTWDNLEFGLRIGDPKVCITTTPKPIKLLREIIKESGVIVTRGSTYENAGNLSPKFLERITKYEGTRFGRQELHAELLDDVPGALWSRAKIDEFRVKPDKNREFIRIVVAIDPGAKTGEDADETGIICVGLGSDGHAYVLDDASETRKPSEWGAEAIAIYRARGADMIVAEINNGGDMVENTIRVIDKNIAYKGVHATRGKAIRAEPVSTLYEMGAVHHVGAFAVLEDQMCAFTTDFDRNTAGYSPDRMDALVWALTELMIVDGEIVFNGKTADSVLEEPKTIARSWRRVFGIDIQRDMVSAVWGAHDTMNNVLHIYGEYEVRRGDLVVHAAAFRDRGHWIPGVFETQGRGRTTEEGERIVERLMTCNVDVFELTEVNDIEAAVEDMNQRISSERLKVSSTCEKWIRQYRNYKRERSGEIKEDDRDGLIRAAGLICIAGLQIAMTDFNVGRADVETDTADNTRSKVTGY